MDSQNFKKEINLIFSDFIMTEKERELFDKTYEVCELKKGDFFLEKGDSWYNFGIILKGSIYSYFYNEKGEKCISAFYYFPQNYYVVDYETFVKETKVDQYYECFEDSVVLRFDGNRFNQYYEAIPGIHKYRLRLAEDRYFRALNTIKLMQSTNANEKVQELYNQSPEIFKKFPYTYIASHLGMHRNTYRKAIQRLKK